MKKVNLLIFLIWILFSGFTQINPSQYRFHVFPSPIGTHEGITSITKDKKGFIWLTTEDDVFLFDGYSFTKKTEAIVGHEQISRFGFNKVLCDNEGHLFLSCDRYGLFMLNKSRTLFEPVLNGNVSHPIVAPQGCLYLLHNLTPAVFDLKDQECDYLDTHLNTIICSHKSDTELWFADLTGKIYQYERKGYPAVFFAQIPSKNKVRKIQKHRNELFVLSENNGLYRYSSEGKLVAHYPLYYDETSSAYAKDMMMDSQGILWVGVQTGLFLIRISNGEQIYLKNDPGNPFSIPYNSIWTVYPDPDCGVWIGAYGGGLAYFNFYDIEYYFYSQTEGNSLSYNIVSCFEEDKQGNIWIGTAGGGLNKFDRRARRFTHYKHEKTANSISYNLVDNLFYDKKEERLWIGTYRGGLNSLTLINEVVNRHELTDKNGNLLRINAYAIQLLNDTLAIITDSERGGGAFRCNLKKKIAEPIGDLIPSLSNSFSQDINVLYLSQDSLLWMGSRNGLLVYDWKGNEVVKSYTSATYPDSLSGNYIYCLLQTISGNMWVGTKGNGVSVIAPQGKIRYMNRANGLDAKVIYSIIEDDIANNIWLSTENGLFQYNTHTESFRKVHIPKVLSSGAFYPNAGFKTNKGEILFGRTNGFIMFDPSRMKVNHYKARAFLTGLYINNQPIYTGDAGSPLNMDISETEKVTLNHNQTNVSIRFASNSYFMPEENRFACRLKGYEDEWRMLASGEHSIYYSRLSPGHYVFEVKTANNNGVWGNETTQLKITVLPPLYFSVWAFALYFLLFCLIAFLLWKNSSRFQSLLRQLRKERIEKEKIKEVIDQKVDFFTNISHELRTPLMLITDPLSQLIASVPKESSQRVTLEIIQRNAQRLHALINQLLDFRAIEEKSVRVKYQQDNIVSFVRKVYQYFVPLADDKDISISFEADMDAFLLYFDKDMMEKICCNLFSNAIKYTPEGETIRVVVKEKNTSDAEISVINTGVELMPEQEKSLFSRFYRVDNLRSRSQSGSGLGLAITRELVELMQGVVSYQYSKGEICFTVVLPQRPVSIQIEEEESDDSSFSYTQHFMDALESDMESRDAAAGQNKRPKILLAEDNADMRHYLTSVLSSDYEVLTAKDGEEAFYIAVKSNPQIIISDIMMPGMDGFELCGKLKTSIETSHIPIILLSALGSDTNKLKGMKQGADIYLEKPIDTQILLQQAHNLMESREKLRKLFERKNIPDPTPISFASTDEVFMNKVMALLEKNMSNENYDVEQFAHDMTASRSLLYKKIKDLTGLSIKSFIMEIKLKRAVQLLTDTDLNISEVADRVGFSEPRYFGACFRKRYGMSPSRFIEDNRKTTLTNKTTL